MEYDFKKIEPKWQARWENEKVFHAEDFSEKPKFYGLVEFPYPSGAGMHVGHIKAYSSLEVISRKRRMQGYNVMFRSALTHSVCRRRITRSRPTRTRVRSRIRILRSFLSS